jgi:hypothetical protein
MPSPFSFLDSTSGPAHSMTTLAEGVSTKEETARPSSGFAALGSIG